MADYEGKLTGAQIDALPEQIAAKAAKDDVYTKDEIDAKIGDIETLLSKI